LERGSQTEVVRGDLRGGWQDPGGGCFVRMSTMGGEKRLLGTKREKKQKTKDRRGNGFKEDGGWNSWALMGKTPRPKFQKKKKNAAKESSLGYPKKKTGKNLQIGCGLVYEGVWDEKPERPPQEM